MSNRFDKCSDCTSSSIENCLKIKCPYYANPKDPIAVAKAFYEHGYRNKMILELLKEENNNECSN